MAPDAGRAPSSTPTVLRLRYSKLGRIRFTSQRDVARMWERALRRSGLPVAWSQGFSPRPLLSFGLALPTGAESLGEYVDVRLEPPGPDAGGGPGPGGGGGPGPDAGGGPGPGGGGGPGHDPDPMASPDTGAPLGPQVAGDLRRRVRAALGRGGHDLADLLTPLLPEGIAVQACVPVPHGAGSLQQEVSSCNWEMEVHGVAPRELTTRVERMLGASSVLVRRERKGRPVDDDLRPGVRTLAVVADGFGSSAHGEECCRLRAELATRPRGVRPGELLEGLGGGLVLARACRTHQWIERDGERREPLGLGGEPPAWPGGPLRECAS